MMHWFWGAALAPLLLCGLMCGVPMLIAMFGFRHRKTEDGNAPAAAPTRSLAAQSDREPWPVRPGGVVLLVAGAVAACRPRCGPAGRRRVASTMGFSRTVLHGAL